MPLFFCHLEICYRSSSSFITPSDSQFNSHKVLPNSLCLYLPLSSKTGVVFSSKALYGKPCGSNFRWKSQSTPHQYMSKGLPRRIMSMATFGLLSTRFKRAPGMCGVWPIISNLHTLQFSCLENPRSQSEHLIRNTGRWPSFKNI